MRGFLVVVGFVLSLYCAAAQANPLKELVSSRGTSTIKYERAVGKRAEFAQLSADGPAAGVAVTVVDDGGTGAGEKVAAAYLEGLRKVLPQSGPLAAGDGTSPQFVARIALSAHEGRAGEATKLIVGAQGTTCMQVSKDKMQCQEIGPAPNAMGKTAATWINPELTVMIRLYRFDPRDSSVAPVVVFEDLYSLSYVQTECTDPGAAAAAVARLLGETALSSRAVNIDFPTTPRALGCNAKT
ncbi:hypothetical protein [Pseudoxanthomonas daejeonensis]|uniref:Secreted protein n=1 Tax=Pseudoxanthomonas daejeonensis TaxID=266062 RepID=A0ABQ6Z3N8_9GAMM|nr:hypothetical protein [Pseudoxanthomonas daejeonensis]KAF1692221.1 hypothetical protein CSC65_14760 [Pseudoxanthomonas daejeonensis]